MLQEIVFCTRCRGMKVGFNRRYIVHWIICRNWRRNAPKLTSLAFLLSVLVLCAPETPVVFSSVHPNPQAHSGAVPHITPDAGEVRSMDAFLEGHGVQRTNRSRLAESIVISGKKYVLNPRLIASILVVESRGNPFAISDQGAVGIMQIHLRTWGNAADREDINLFDIEDNIDFGARILKTYVNQFGMWEGVKRYHGFLTKIPGSEEYANGYVAKVQKAYGFQPPAAEAEVLQ